MAFSDVKPSTQFHREITWVTDIGIATGWPDGTFRPVQPVKRDAMAAFLFRLANPQNYQPPATSPFTDITPGTQFYKEIAWLAEKGIAGGYEDGTYRPLEPVNRDAMAAFMYRLVGSPKFTPPTRSPFVDVTPTTKFYKEMAWLSARRISTGWPDRTFRPLEPVNRDAMAAFIYRLAAFWPARVYTGTGNRTFLLPRLGVRYWVARIEHTPTNNALFEAWTIDNKSAAIGPIAGFPGGYRGTVGLTTSGPGGASVAGLKLTAPSAWKVTVIGADALPRLPSSGSYQGMGDEVVRVDNARGKTVRFNFPGSGGFTALVMDAAGTWLAMPEERGGSFSSTYTIPGNAYTIEIVADGAWSIAR